MRLAVAGSPVTHSLSPLIHTTALALCAIPGTYEAIECDAAGFSNVLEAIRSGELDGCNVTMPHKRLAYELVDDHAAVADRTGAVNTVVRVGEQLVGHNTDVAGIIVAAADAGLPDTAPVLILGTGGAAAAALVAFDDRDVFLAGRRRERAEALAERTGVGAAVVEFGEPVDGALVVNATPIGMGRETLPHAVLDVASGLFEMPYAAGVTPATVAARQRGIPVAGGEDMLLAQALESFRLWTGRTPPSGPVRQALRTRPPSV